MAKKIAPTPRPSATRGKHHPPIFAASKRSSQTVPWLLSGEKTRNCERYFNETLENFRPAQLPDDLTKEQQRTWKLSFLAYWLRDAHGRRVNG